MRVLRLVITKPTKYMFIYTSKLGGVATPRRTANPTVVVVPQVVAPAKTIVDGSATSLANIYTPTGTVSGGFFTYTVLASDGTDFQSLSGLVTYAAVNKAGALTLTITEVAANQAKAVSAGTLTLAWTFVANADNSGGIIKLQPTGSLTETVYTVTATYNPVLPIHTLGDQPKVAGVRAPAQLNGGVTLL